MANCPDNTCLTPGDHCAICGAHNALDENGVCWKADQPEHQNAPAEDDIADAEIVSVPAEMTKAEAKAVLGQVSTLMDTLYATADQIDKLLVDLHDRKGWKALGFSSWVAFVDEKLPFGERRARQRVKHGRIVLQLEASAETGTIVPPEGRTRGHSSAEDFLAHQERRRAQREAEAATPVRTPLAVVPEPGPTATDLEPFGSTPEPTRPRRTRRVAVGTATEVIPRPARAPKPSKADIRRVEDMLPALTQVQEAVDRIGAFPALPTLERRRHWLREIDTTRRALKVLEDKIKTTMSSAGTDE